VIIFLEQQIVIKFCVKECKLHLRGLWGRKSPVVFSGINSSKRVVRTWKMKEVVIQDLTEPMKM